MHDNGKHENNTMHQRQLWYVRRGSKVSGPFPTQVVVNNTLLGRFLFSDEVSLDQSEWKKLMTVPELLPHELVALQNETDPDHRQWLEERLKAAQRWSDQRTFEQRQHGGKPIGEERRIGAEDSDVLASPHHHADLLPESGVRRYLGVIVGLMVALLLVALGLIYYQPVNPVKVAVIPVQPQCGKAAAPGIDWSGCDMQGKLLRGVDLSRAKLDYANFSRADLSGSRLEHVSLVGANLNAADLNNVDLSNADLSNTDLTDANLLSATLDGAVLSHAIWSDGRVCAEGSVGQCQ